MGGCEHRYLAMTWAAPIHSKIGSKTTQKGGMGGLLRNIFMGSSTEGVSPSEMMNWMYAGFKIEVKNSISSMIEKRPSDMPRAVFFLYKVHDHFDIREWIPINCSYPEERFR